MISELKSISSLAVVVEGVSSNGVQSSFKFAVNPQTQDRDLLERASKAVPTLLDLIGVRMATTDAAKPDDLDSLDDVPISKKRRHVEIEDDAE